MRGKNVIVFFLCSLIVLLTGVKTVKAIEEEIIKVDAERNVLVLYSTEFWEMDENTRLLDLTIGHFTNQIEYRNVHDLEGIELDEKTHLFYYGHIEEKLPQEFTEMVESFEGPTMAIGYNVEQLGQKFDYITMGHEMTITEINYLGDLNKVRTIEPNIVFEATLDEDAEVLVQGKGDQGTFPLLMRKNENYYLAADSFDRPYSVYFSQVLNTFFDSETTDKTPAYIRLEDIHPLSDPGRLRAAAEELAKREIPYMMAVIPVYTDPESGRKYHFEDHREILDILRFMQDNGGSIILHGYTHQFRQSETGEGFEFWDVENEMPIYHGPEDEVIERKRSDFETEEEYESYLTESKAYEREYIEERLTRGVQELVNYGLYPLAFEAPHYTLSQNGYEVVSDHFSTYVGQVQLSDERWEIMDTTPYASQPTILKGMTLLPETIGYVQPEVNEPVEEMMSLANFYQVTEGGMIGAFYHPYLGIEGLQALLDEMETIENLEWIDLKKMENVVKVDHVNIQSGNGDIEVKVSKLGLMTSSLDFSIYHIKEIVIVLTWIIAIVGIAAVLMFISFTIYLSGKRRQLDRAVIQIPSDDN